MDDVCAGEVNDAVAVGVRRRDVNHFDLLAIEMKGERIIEGDNGQAGFRAVPIAAELFGDVCVRDDMRVAAEVGIPAGMIAMEMGVEHESEFPGIEFLERGLDLLRERSKLV